MTKFEIEQEIIRLKNKKSGLAMSKCNIQTELADVNAKFVGRLNNTAFANLREKRADLCKLLNETEHDLRNISDEIRRLSVEKERDSQTSSLTKTTIEALVSIRDDYQMFAADKTRVGSMRQMAAEFVTRLNPVIRKAIGTN